MNQYINRLSHALFNFLIPPFCSVCRQLLENRSVLCHSCASLIKPIVSHQIVLDSRYTMRVHALSDYQMPLKKLILAKRYGNSVASRQLGRLMSLCAPMDVKTYDAVIPIPLHWLRYMHRGYNQTEEIADVLAKAFHIQVCNVLRRGRHTAYQTGMSKQERRTNISNAFKLVIKDKDQFNKKRLLLIDDVVTTGETVRAAAKELIKCKPASIDVFVACRVV